MNQRWGFLPQWPFFSYLPGNRQSQKWPTMQQHTYPPPPLGKSFICTFCDRKGTPFVYLLLTNGSPLLIASLECCIPFNCFKCDWLTAEPKCSWLFHSYKMHLLALLGLFTDQNDISQALGFQIPWITIVRFCAQRSWETVSNNFFVPWNLIGAPFYFF